jgi:predicted dienelactone hydrolase
MVYDPFAPGPFAVGVRAGIAIDRTRDDRRLPFEVWYPELAGAGRHPLIAYCHASFGHGRQSVYLSTHLASHGYVVAAADHTGNAAADLVERTQRRAAGEVPTTEEADAYLRKIIDDRVPDLRFLLDHILGGAVDGVSAAIDEQRVGLVGWSFGGWAVLATPEVDDRVAAVVALAPAGNSKPLPGIIPAPLTFAWKREVPTLFLVAERDRFTPLSGEYELFERTPSRKRMFILQGADHQHFDDQIVDPGPCSPEHAHTFTRGLSLAHLDAVMRSDNDAEGFMDGDPVAALRERGVNAVDYRVEASIET